MDKDRPSLDLKHFGDICPDKNGMSKLNAAAWGTEIDIGNFSSPCDSAIHEVRSIQTRGQDEVGGPAS
jgi:hypothetical protein